MRRPLGLFCLILIGMIFLLDVLHPPKKGEYAAYNGENISITGQVTKKEVKYNNLCITINKIQRSNSDQLIPYDENELQIEDALKDVKGVVCYFPYEESILNQIKLGAYIRVSGKIQEYENATNPGEFDMDSYYAYQKIDFKLYDPVFLGTTLSYYKVSEGLYQFKLRSEQLLDQIMSETESSIMKSILLGDKAAIDLEVKENFKISGISHILAISGLHIALIGGLLYRLLKQLGVKKQIGVLLSLVLILLFGIMTGMPTSAFRAMIMFGLRMIAEAVGRTYDSLTAIALAAALIALESPGLLMTSGMQLSFAAVLGMTLFMPLWKGRRLKFLHAPFCIFLATFPISLYYYYTYSVYSVFLNLLVVPLMTVVMMLGLVTLLLGYLSFPLALLPGKILCLILLFYEKISDLVSSLPNHTWTVGQPKIWQIIAYYLALLLLLTLWKNLSVQIVFAWILVALSLVAMRCYESPTMALLDIGQGDGIVIIDRKGNCLTVDGGSTTEKNIGKYILVPYLQWNGIDSIEYSILTHLDADHYSGIQEILENPSYGITIKHLVFSEAVKESDEARETYLYLCELAKENNCEVLYLGMGDQIQLCGVELNCVWPKKDTYEDLNSGSVVLEVSSKRFKGLLTGDIAKEQEEEMIGLLHYESYQLLKAAHHGSKYSNCESFLARVRPDEIWISCGENNTYGHPHKEALERMKQLNVPIEITKDDGCLVIKLK